VKRILVFVLLIVLALPFIFGAIRYQGSTDTTQLQQAPKTEVSTYSENGQNTAKLHSQEMLMTNSSPKSKFISIIRGLFGIIILIGIGYLFSVDRKSISWKLVITGLIIQIALGVAVLYIPFIQDIFNFIGSLFVKVLDSTKSGAKFLFGDLVESNKYGVIFAFQILPTILFFSALMSLLFYLGIVQKIVYALAWLLNRAMKLSGAESLATAGNIFMGQTESPLMIKAYLPKMTPSEIFLVMTSGMATIAGGVMAAYIGMLGGEDPVQRIMFARHLITASVMAAPGAVVIAKILVPQTENIDKEIVVSKEKIGSNVLDAVSNGTIEGLKLAANVGAMLIVFLSFIALINFIFNKFGVWFHLNEKVSELSGGQYKQLSLEFILGYVFAPLMWVIGVVKEDITLLGRLMGEKLILTEFIGYGSLAKMNAAGAFFSQKSTIMATYMLCGFANFASVGIQIGGIGSLAPNKRVLLSEFGIRALIGGTIASLLSATIIGMIIG
jgi:CNT family concentrative nucleoside transporter